MESNMVIEKSPGMGSVVSKESNVTFRVWAPHADRVIVVGSFCNWSEKDGIDLNPEENGYWAAVTNLVQVGNEYKYLIVNDNNKFYRNDPYAFELTNSNGNSIVRKLDFDWKHDFKMPPWNELVIYELHVGTFHRPDPEKVGTFDDVIQKLPYLKQLGVNCIEILPVAEFAGGISWGYNPAHPFAIEQDYGGPDAFAKFVDEAHGHGMAVIVDVVYNHLGPSDVDLWQFDGWQENDKGGIYFYNDHRSETPWGDTRPDYGRPEVRQYLRDNALMWIEKYHCDGLRMDATSYIRYEGGGLGYDSEIEEGNILMRDINAELQEKHPTVLTIAEDLKGDSRVTDPFDNGGLGYGSQWDMEFVHSVREVLLDTHDDTRDLDKLVKALEFKYSGDSFRRVVYTESHDEVANGKARVPEEIQPGDAESPFAKKRALLGIVLTLTAPGIPMLFQGQEFLEDEYFQDTEALDWSKHDRLSSIKDFVAELCKLRSGQLSGAFGLRAQGIVILHYNQATKVLAYLRDELGGGSEPVLVLMNLRNTAYEDYRIGLPDDGPWQLRLHSTWEGNDDDFSGLQVNGFSVVEEETDGCPLSLKTNLPAYGALIFTKKV